jgi:Ca2+-binding RTX toxin-like protein
MARIPGTNGNDWFWGKGTRGDDEYYGYDGNDTFFSSLGNDTYDGGTGFDYVDYQFAKTGIWVDLRKGYGTHEGYRDTYVSIEGIRGTDFRDVIHGNDVTNLFHGGEGDDSLFGYGGHDGLDGEEGNDELWGGSGNDILSGGEDNDTLIGGPGADQLYGGVGIDTVSYVGSPTGVAVDLSDGFGYGGDAEGDRIYQVENITGSAYDDILVGSKDNNVLKGEGGNDRLVGGAGGDVLDGGEGSDTASYETASQGVIADLLNPAVNAYDAEGDTYISIENLLGSYYDDTLKGDDGSNFINGLSGHDWLYGRGGDDRFLVYLEEPDVIDGTSLVDGGSGVDSIAIAGFGGSGVDVTFYGNGNGLAVGAYGFTYLYSIENVNGTAWGDTIRGDEQENLFDGNAGNDIIDGGGGDDVLFGGENSDTFVFVHSGHSNEHDTVMDFQPGVDRIDLSATPVQNFSDLFSPGDRYMEDVGNDVLIHTSASNGTDILLMNVQFSSLTSGDFLF